MAERPDTGVKMKTVNRYSSILFTVFLALLFCSCGLSAQIDTRETSSHQEQKVVQPATEPEPPAESGSVWRSFLWEALPAQWLRSPTHSVVVEAYQQNGWIPCFITARFELNDNAAVLLENLDDLETRAIDPRPYKLDELRQKIQSLGAMRSSAPTSGHAGAAQPQPPFDPETHKALYQAAAELDILLAGVFVRYCTEMDPFSGESQALALSGQVPMGHYLSERVPASPHYEPLLRALARYRKMAAETAHHPVRTASSLRSGHSGTEVRDLQKRLHQEDFYHGKITGVFDAATLQAVRQFQASHNLDADGVVGGRTLEWLNVSYKAKSEMIASSITALRQSQTRRNERYVRINIPQFMLEYYRDGRPQSLHRVIVGKSSGKKIKVKGRWVGENQTPVLASSIEQVVINPRWYVSDRIRLELNQMASSDPEYFTRHGYVRMNSTHPWGEPRLFQRPGPTNPLGRIKFEFPNDYAVYLHDTPKKQLFQRSRRDFSHGCIRVEKADVLAEILLKDDANPAAEKAASYLSNERQVFIRLTDPVSIIIEYLPVGSNDGGQVIFFGDPYGWLSEKTNPGT